VDEFPRNVVFGVSGVVDEEAVDDRVAQRGLRCDGLRNNHGIGGAADGPEGDGFGKFGGDAGVVPPIGTERRHLGHAGRSHGKKERRREGERGRWIGGRSLLAGEVEA
jgi:hypothetical protein